MSFSSNAKVWSKKNEIYLRLNQRFANCICSNFDSIFTLFFTLQFLLTLQIFFCDFLRIFLHSLLNSTFPTLLLPFYINLSFFFFYSKGLSTFNMFCRNSTYFVFSVIFLSFLILLLMSIFSFNLYSIFIHYFFLIHFPNVCFIYIACNQHKYLIPILFVKIL